MEFCSLLLPLYLMLQLWQLILEVDFSSFCCCNCCCCCCYFDDFSFRFCSIFFFFLNFIVSPRKIKCVQFEMAIESGFYCWNHLKAMKIKSKYTKTKQLTLKINIFFSIYLFILFLLFQIFAFAYRRKILNFPSHNHNNSIQKWFKKKIKSNKNTVLDNNF